MSHKHQKSGDKIDQWWSSIQNEKLSELKYVMLHSGLNVSKLQNDDGITGLQLAAMNNKPKALLVILDILRSKRELVESIDVEDGDGKTALMLACEVGAVKCVDHLIYYKASLKKKSNEGKTARDYAVMNRKNDVVELIDEELNGGKELPSDQVEEVDADGLTSTQRSKLKKKAMMDAERKGALVAVASAAGATASLQDLSLGDEPGDGVEGSNGSGEAAAVKTSSATSNAPSINQALDKYGRKPLPNTMPTPRWQEITTVLLEKRRELNVTVPSIDSVNESVSPTLAGFAQSEASHVDEDDVIDPALFHCTLLNRLEIHIGPRLKVLTSHIGHLSSLQTLILSHNSLSSVPESILACSELKNLDLSYNQLESLPSSLSQLPKLEVLDVSGNKLVNFSALKGSSSIVKLLADKNLLEDMSDLSYKNLSRLETLSVSYNHLASIPDEIGEISSMMVFNISENQITELPSGLANMKEKKIREFKVLPNPIEDKKVLKILTADRPEKVVKELFKYLQANEGGGKKGKKK
jgi:Leucine rich repeat/Ankyrin repeats (3 copies)